MIPYIMRGRLGGKRSPKVPEVVRRPRENLSWYFPCFSAGKRIPPRAIMVSPVAPVRAVKMAQANKEIIDSPPGNQPRSAFDNLISLLGVPLSERRYPAKVKSGIAIKIGVVAIRYISIIIAEESISPRKSNKKTRAESTMKIGVPEIIRIRNIPMRIYIIFHHIYS